MYNFSKSSSHSTIYQTLELDLKADFYTKGKHNEFIPKNTVCQYTQSLQLLSTQLQRKKNNHRLITFF